MRSPLARRLSECPPSCFHLGPHRVVLGGGNPLEAKPLTVGIMALVAQQEREAISRRTKEALSVARSRGVRLGNPKRVEQRRAGKGGAPLRAAIAQNADRHAQDLAPVVEDILTGGALSLRATGRSRMAGACSTRRGGALARPVGHEPARSARAQAGGMRRSRLTSLVRALTM